eukprot:15805318-Heterocapsa_arctica.AAC.1
MRLFLDLQHLILGAELGIAQHLANVVHELASLDDVHGNPSFTRGKRSRRSGRVIILKNRPHRSDRGSLRLGA